MKPTEENRLLLREGRKIVEALGKTLAPLVEVVLHDLTDPDHAVVAIANNLSGRQVGDAVTELGLARLRPTRLPGSHRELRQPVSRRAPGQEHIDRAEEQPRRLRGGHLPEHGCLHAACRDHRPHATDAR